MKRILFVLLFVLATFVVSAADFEISIQQYPKEAIKGVPINISCEVRNCSGRSLQIAYGVNGFSVLPKVYKSDGIQVESCKEDPEKRTSGFILEEISTDWKKIYSFPLCISLAAEYEIKICVLSKGPFKKPNGEEVKAWQGEISSESHIITLKEPTSIDKEVYDYFKGHPLSYSSEVLQKYPISTYAAYIIYQSSAAKGLMASDPINIAKVIACGGLNYPESVPDDTGKWKDGWQILTAENYPKWRDKWFEIILKNHPDIWFADALRLRRAVEDYSHKKTESLLTDIETLSKTGSPEVAKKAQEILAALKSVEGEKKKEVEIAAPKTAPIESRK